MNKIYLLGLAAALTSAVASGQSQRLVLLEHFTGASCPPCATFNPAVNQLLNANPDKIIGLKYQLAPPGTDPMYNHNTQHSGARAGYYQVSGIPNSVLDGNFYNDHPNGWGISNVNARYDVPSPYDIEISYEITPTEIEAQVTVTASQDFTDNNLRLHTVIVEEDITFSEPPGTNGETEFKNVMKRMLPNQSGTTLPSSWTEGQSETFTLSWNHANVYNYDQLAVIAFVQNNTTKEVHQAAFNNEGVITSPFSLAAQVVEFSGTPEPTCEGNEISFTPEVTLLNFGLEALTEAEIVFEINGEEYSSSWTGNSSLLEEMTVTFDEITAVNQGINNISVSAVSVNNNSNEVESAYQTEVDLSSALTDNLITVNIELDNWPEETTWEIVNPEGVTVADGGPYADQENETVSVDVELEELGCFFFNMFDEFGDGLNGSQWGTNFSDGSANITDSQGNVILDYDGSTEFSGLTAPFEVDNVLSNSEQNPYLSEITIFPNPTSGMLNIEFNLLRVQNTTIDVIDISGKTMVSQRLGTLGEGQYLRSVDLTSLAPGMYFVNFTTGDTAKAFKVTITN